MFGFKMLFNGICFFLFVCVTFEVDANAPCSKPNTYPNVVLTSESSNLNDFPDGTTVKYECIPGYVTASGRMESTCSDGKWSRLTLECKKRSCGPPPDVINGRYNTSEGTDFGARIYVICHEGYELAGNIAYRNCRVNGWDNHDPVCHAVPCGEPPEIKDGIRDTDSPRSYQDSVGYTCNDGYTLIGSSLITCSADGTFKPAPPNCTVVRCTEPDIAHGMRKTGSPPYGYQSFIIYECMKGYAMDGQAQLTCDVNGWSPGIPTCNKVLPTTRKTTTTTSTPRPTVHVSQPSTIRKVTTSKAAVTTRSTTHDPKGKGASITPHALSVAVGLLFPAIMKLFL